MNMCMRDFKQLDSKTRTANILAFITLALAFIAIVTVIIWMVYPYTPMVINKRPLPVVNKIVKQGDILYYHLDYCKQTEEPTRISRKFTDGIIYSVPDIFADNARGCREQTIGIDIPKALPAGKYIVTISYAYQMNPIREVSITTHTESFVVTE